MAFKFSDIYEEMIALEQAINHLQTDIDNFPCDSITKCRLENELWQLQKQYEDLCLTEFDFEELNFVTIIESIERCMFCIEFGGDFSDIAPPPFAVASSCSGENQLTLDDIEAVRVWELTTSQSPAESNLHEYTKQAMPYTIVTRASERYVVTYDSLRHGLSIKGFNRISDQTVTGFGNIARVDVKLSPNAQARYRTEWVTACKVLLTTPTPMHNSFPLSRAIDGNTDTCPSVAPTTKSVVEMIFQIFV